MRPVSFVSFALACALSALPPRAAAAQTESESNLVLTILGGTVTGHSLWAVAKQPLTVLGNPTLYDTLALSRSIGSSLVLGVAGTYFLSSHVGLHGEVSYLGLPIDSNCQGLFYNADAENKNEQLCDNIAAQNPEGGAIAIFGGVTIRAVSRRAFSPYLAGSLGIVNHPRSTLAMDGGFVTSAGPQARLVIVDDNPRATSVMVGAAAGFTTPLGPGYQFRLEVRDAVLSLDRLIGPANALGTGPAASRTYHHFALTLGLDVVLERKRGRRY
jgi:hypothetical protein